MTATRKSLRRTWERVRSVPGLGRDVAAFAVVIVLGLTSGGIILANENVDWPWGTSFEFAADFGSVPGVNTASDQEVRIAGVRVGKIKSTEISQGGHARLTMTVEPGHPIYDNARLVLRPQNPLNAMYVEISPGGPPGHPLPAQGVIPVSQTERPIQADEVLQHLDDRTRSALTNALEASDTALAHAPRQLPAGLAATDSTVKRFKPVVDALQQRRDKIAEVVTALTDIARATGKNDERFGRLVSSTETTLHALSQRGGEVSAALRQLPGVGDQLRQSMDTTRALTDQLNPTLDNVKEASGALPPTLSRLTGTVGRLGDTVESAKPVVSAAGPVVADLRPLVGNANGALDQLRPVTGTLEADTRKALPYLNDLAAFFYNTSNTFSLVDANGGFARGHVVVQPGDPLGAAPAKGGQK